MATYLHRIDDLVRIQAETAKGYGTSEQIALLYSLGTAEDALTKTVYANITSEKDRMKLIEETTKRHLELLDQIMAKELTRAKLVNDQVIAELAANEKLMAARGLTLQGAPSGADPLGARQRALDELNRDVAANISPGRDGTSGPGVSSAARRQVIEDAFNKALLDSALAADKLRDG